MLDWFSVSNVLSAVESPGTEYIVQPQQLGDTEMIILQLGQVEMFDCDNGYSRLQYVCKKTLKGVDKDKLTHYHN